MSETRAIARAWGRRYVGAVAVLATIATLVAFLPSRIPVRMQAGPRLPATETPEASPAPRASAQPARPSAPIAEPSTAPATPLGAIGAAPPDVDGASDAPAHEPACSLELPATDPPPPGVPILLAFLPLVGPFGPEAVAALPLVVPFLVPLLPFVPLAQPSLEPYEPLLQEAIDGALLVERKVFDPLEPLVETFRPEALAFEQEVVAVLAPVAQTFAEGPVVGCVYQVNSLVVAQLIASGLAG
ncbi:MAG: hypothetical protein WD646_13520 [Actinomycetota bacterium]